MQALTPEQFHSLELAFDDAARHTPGIDRFCSSSSWVLPAHRAFLAENPMWLRQSEHGFVAMAQGEDAHLGRYLHPLEASWALACPLLGPQPRELCREFVQVCRKQFTQWDLLFMSGLALDSPLYIELVRGFRTTHYLGLGAMASRRIASLQGGVEGFLSRRGPRFRHNLRRAERLAQAAGVCVEHVEPAQNPEALEALLSRIMALEAQSWKGQSHTGILEGPMQVFYHEMFPRLAARKSLRALFLTLDGQDLAFCFGAVFDDSFRGLQMSYHNGFRHLTPGSLAQLAMIRRLCEEGVGHYDLGSDMPYKEDWAEGRMDTVALIVRK